MVTIEYTCADGTPFPFTFESEEQAAMRWRFDREHGRDPATPLGLALGRLGAPGAQRCYDETDLVLPASFRPGPSAFGFAFFAENPMSAEEMVKMVEGCGRLVTTYGSALGIWHDLCMPNSKAACAFLDEAGLDVPLAALAEQESYGQQMTMLPAYVCGNDLDLLSAAIKDLYGDEANLVAYELTQGHECETLRADQELWLLGRRAAAVPEVMEALRSDDAPAAMADLRAAGAHRDFFAAVDGFLAEFGGRGESWDIACPTWDELGPGFWGQLVQMASPEAPEPRVVVARGKERREALVAEIEARLADEPEKLARFQRRLERIAPYVAVREERAHWQLVLAGSLRGAVLRRGAALVEAGVLDRPDDVLYLLPPEIDGALAGGGGGDLRAAVAERRAEHEHWMTKVPPVVVGGVREDGTTAEAELTPFAAAFVPPPPPSEGPVDGVIRGLAVSRGVAKGTARVIVDLADADRFEPGDVLVCVMTSPPWTPLFALASAVVADTGGMGSHPAIAAREYGIPCVLGTAHGTRSIPDGAVVVVDGEQGTVELVDIRPA